MNNFLLLTAVTLGIAVLIGFLNEKLFHLTYEISLLLFSVPIGLCATVIFAAIRGSSVHEFLSAIQVYDLENYLLKGVLCFMLFAGSCRLKLGQFKENMRNVTIFAFFCTFLGAVIYGLLFWCIATIFVLPFSLPACLMFGSIIAPTDPIAATSILKKFGLPKLTGFLMEGESLLNDGVGVALFVVFSQIVTQNNGEGFLFVMFREIAGAVFIGCMITVLCFQVIRFTQDKHRRILASLFCVSCAYVLCEAADCSGAIACVVCGVIFSTLRTREEERGINWELEEFDGFWEMLDTLLNSTLYVIMGLSFVRILQMDNAITLSILAIVCNFAARFGSLYASTYLMKSIPDGFDRNGFSLLFTWAGLRGGLSIALAMSTVSMLPGYTYHILIGCVYSIVFFTTVVQGLSVKKVYRGILNIRKL